MRLVPSIQRGQANAHTRFASANSLMGAAALVTIATLALGGGQAARAATVSCGAIDATSIISGVPPTPNCAYVQSGNDFEINFSGVLDVNKKYSLQVANLSTGASNTQTFNNVQLLVTGAIGSTSFSNSPITIWPSNNGADTSPPFLAQGISGYSTNPTSNTFNSVNVSTNANFSLTSPQTNIGLGTAGSIFTEPLQLSSVGITSFTAFSIRGTFTGSGPFAAGLGIYDSTTDTTTQPPDLILGNAFNLAAPGPLPVLGAGAAFGWSRRLRRRIGASKSAA